MSVIIGKMPQKHAKNTETSIKSDLIQFCNYFINSFWKIDFSPINREFKLTNKYFVHPRERNLMLIFYILPEKFDFFPNLMTFYLFLCISQQL